jgi:hypothetical protein
MGLLLRAYRPGAGVVAGAMTTTVVEPSGESEPSEPGESSEVPEPVHRGRFGRVVRLALWSAIGLLVLREALDGFRGAERRTRRAVSGWWYDVERRSRQDTRRGQIGVLASLVGRRR